MFELAYSLAMEVYKISKGFPKEERYALTDQIRRASRNVAADIAEGFRKRQYPGLFTSRLADADGEATEVLVWLDFARDCGYLEARMHERLVGEYELIGRMLGSMIKKSGKFTPQ